MASGGNVALVVTAGSGTAAGSAAGSRLTIENELNQLRGMGLAKNQRAKYKSIGTEAVFMTPEEAASFLAEQKKASKRGQVKPTPPKGLSAGELDSWYMQQKAREADARKKREEAEALLRGFRMPHELASGMRMNIRPATGSDNMEADESLGGKGSKPLVKVMTAVDDTNNPSATNACDEVADKRVSLGDNLEMETSIHPAHSGQTAQSSTSAPSIQPTLTRGVVMKCPNGDLFSGLTDGVTGEPVEGRLVCAKTGETYEGTKWHDGSMFFGSFRNGNPYEGTVIAANYTYQGRLLVPQPSLLVFHGSDGTLLQRNGDIYKGGFSHGRYHGEGRERTISGLNYYGQYKSGKWHGMGDLIFEHGASAAGGADADSRRSADEGLPFNPNAFRYTYRGEWRYGERDGTGFEKITFGLNQSLSLASCSNSKESTLSNSKIANESILEKRTATYEGKFHKDRRHGSGVLVLPDGTVAKGIWEDGVPLESTEYGEIDVADPQGGGAESPLDGAADKQGLRRKAEQKKGVRWKIKFPNGDKYRGECARAPVSAGSEQDGVKSHLHINTSSHVPIMPHGQGTMTSARTGDVYEGSFLMGKRHGFGRCVRKRTGEVFEDTRGLMTSPEK